ncbi:MAG: single-stranded-DNA-specific exonuclease RecJ [Solirubrobacteraceae bacterium]
MSEAAALAAATAPASLAPPRGAPLAVVRGSADPAGRDDAAAQPPAPRLEVPTYELPAALTLERELAISHVLAQVLVRRGIVDPHAAREFLDPREAHDPGAFAGIEHAVGLIERHIGAGSRIVVHGDYDVDGVCATAIMVRALRARGSNVGWFLPSRIDDGYGVSGATVGRLAASRTSLLITVDCGITAVDEVAGARAAGVDVVVCDHHAPRADGALPDCPIVHPAVCGYPCPDLCGSAVAHKLAQALGADTTGEDIELVALATIADLVPLRGENRRLTREGLTALASTGRAGLRALMAVAGADPSALDSHAVAFRLAPRINAAGRLTRADAGLELLLTTDPQRAAEIAAELDAVNAERRAIEQRTVWEAEAQVSELGPRAAYVLAAEGWHPGVIGIVASRVVERHYRPAILIALDGELGTGSGRSIPGFDLLGALHAGAGQLERYGGHRAAAGLTVRRDRVAALREVIEAHAERILAAEQLVPCERVDAVVSGSELGLGLADELSRLEPCGLGNPRARLLVPGARFGDLRPMGEGRHARFSVSSGGTRARAVAFGCEGRLAASCGPPLDATFRLERNAWRGAVEARLVLGHAQPCAPAPIEVLGEDEGDFLRAVLSELESAVESAGLDRVPGAARRVVLDRRGESPLAVLADALAGGGAVLALCADVPRRIGGLQARIGGFALSSYHALGRDPELGARFGQLVALDPPASRAARAVLEEGSGFAHLAWGQDELRFAQQMHELEYGLRTPLTAFYRGLRPRERAAGEELERLLRGDGPHGRPARLAARLIKVLVELELVSLDRDLPALAVVGASRTVLERSPAFRVYAQRYEDGRRYLSSANPPPSG